jgi:hypothetical protein
MTLQNLPRGVLSLTQGKGQTVPDVSPDRLEKGAIWVAIEIRTFDIRLAERLCRPESVPAVDDGVVAAVDQDRWPVAVRCRHQ